MYNENKHLKLSIDIGNVFTKFIVLKKVNDKENFINARMISTPPNLLDEDGNINNPESLEKFLDMIIHETKKDKKNRSLDVVVYLTLSYIENHTIHFPDIEFENKDFDKELSNLIATSDKFDSQNFVFNYRYNNAINTQLGYCDTLILGYDNNIINFYLKFFDKRDIYVKSISLSNLSIAEFLPKVPVDEVFESEYSLLVDLGAKTTEVVLLKNNFPVNYYIVDFGGNSLTESIRDNTGLNFQDAEALKIATNEEHGVFLPEGKHMPGSPEAAKVISILKPIFQNWLRQLYSEVNAELQIEKIKNINTVYVTGGSSYIHGFPEAIASQFNSKLEEIDISEHFNLKKIQQEIEIVSYHLHLFLPVLSHIKVKPLNLVRKEYIKSKKTKMPKVKGGFTVLVISSVLFLGANGIGFFQTHSNSKQIDNINNKMGELLVSYESEKSQLADYNHLLATIKGYEEKLVDNINWSELMRTTYAATPENVQIMKVHEIGDKQIEIVGRAVDYKLVGNFGKKLESQGALIEVEILDIQNEKVTLGAEGSKEMNLKKFVIRGKIPANKVGGQK